MDLRYSYLEVSTLITVGDDVCFSIVLTRSGNYTIA
jgi:hypothetical protein